jgi:phosphoglycolate phosphatase-like HAD superfamily hydrolase
MKCYLFDIDGTIADCSHRVHHIENKDWRAFFAACGDDAPIPHIIELAQDLTSAGRVIVYVSGRSDECRRQTSIWLGRHELPAGALYMRKAGDHRPDNLVKAELLDQVIADGFEPIMAFDDRNQVVKMWRERGVPCAQVAEGDF